MVKLEDFKVGEIKKMVSKYNKEVKITTSGLKKADLIKKIREHPRLTVTESDKGVSIKVNSDTTMGGKKIKIKKDKQSSKSKDDENIAEQVKEKPAAEGTKPKAQLGQSGIGKKRKRVEGPPKKKKVIDVAVKKEKPKPKVPTITVTEEEKPKKKVIKRGGRYITVKPKEPKADLPPIPKPKAKIRVAPKKKKEKAEPAEKEEKKLPKFKKVEKMPEASIEQLTGMIAYQKKQGNDTIVKQLEKELKEFKGKGKAKKEESDDEDEPKINVKLLAARAKVKGLKQQMKELKEEGKSTKRIEKEIRMAELKLSKMKK